MGKEPPKHAPNRARLGVLLPWALRGAPRGSALGSRPFFFAGEQTGEQVWFGFREMVVLNESERWGEKWQRMRVVSTTVQKSFYRNGRLREEVPLRKGRRHGLARTWHKNGSLASEENYEEGLAHGICRQWNETGQLLGQYRMLQGTGIQRAWHDNGQLQLEVSTVGGEFCGRNRIWLRDGTLISERFYLHGRKVSAEEYRAAATEDERLPKLRGNPAILPPKNQATKLHIHRVFVSWLLDKRNRCEARKWFHKQPDDSTSRLLGRFLNEKDAAQFIEELYKAGATGVTVPDIYSNQTGDQFADCLLVRLPKDRARRDAVRRVCAKLGKRKLGAIEPSEDIEETHLYLSMG